ncbi:MULTISPECIES: inner membrane-spanning protein YciB [Rhodomicrobium]|uniref:inner membrane-spanning protein YciB n=1 Tax=Rhodomicrobium TaxID=1068 RepID=UPI000B4BABCB|nr:MULTISPECIES: inner membrane-spanning protein YciB [Rhodomicrobium]
MLKGYSSSTKLIIKLSLEFMPLALFFLASTKYGFATSTAVLMVATVVSLIVTWNLFRQLALMAIITAATGILAGAVTLGLHDPKYIQMKPTVVSLIFAAILLAGLIFEKPLFKLLLGQALHLNEDGWRVLTWLWFGYFLFISGLNEYIWRTHSWEFWAAFKAFGLMPLTVLFAVPQMYLLKRYRTEDADEPAPETAAKPEAKQPPLKARPLESTTP